MVLERKEYGNIDVNLSGVLQRYYAKMGDSRMDLLSVPEPGAVAKPGETAPRQATRVGVYEQPVKGGTLSSTYDLMQMGRKSSGNGEFLGWRVDGGPYQWHTYDKVNEVAVTLGVALKKSGLTKGDSVGIFAANCPNWTIADLAISSQGMVVAPLYDSLAPGAVKYIVNHAQIQIAFVQDIKVSKVLEVLDECPSLKLIVAVGKHDVESVGEFPANAKVVTMAEFLKKGSYDESQLNLPGPDDLSMLMYTSGTTGDPKGVMITNRSFIAGVSCGAVFLGEYGGPIAKADRMLSFLPLAHIFGQCAEKSFMLGGGKIGYWQGDIKQIRDDLISVRPTIFFAVPRVYARFEQSIRETVEKSSFIKRALFDWGYNTQVANIQNHRPRNKFWDKLVFSKIREKILPDLRFCVTGAAPMSKDTQDFFKVVLCAPVCQGYGMTETCGVTCCAPPCKAGEIDIGTSGDIGGPMNGWVKLMDVPDMNYLTTDKPYPRGEVATKGPTVFSGYYKNEKETKAVILEDGWFLTGDIGQLLPDGSFQIIDRKKNLFKLAHGEYVSPEHIEAELVKAKLVAQLWVYGNSLERSLVGIVVPDVIQWQEWAKKHGKEYNLEALSKDAALKADVLAQMDEMRVSVGFRSFEKIADIRYMTDLNDMNLGFTIENELLTPTMKMKRNILQKRFQAELDEMYAALK